MAKDKSPALPVVERAVRFRFNQFSFSPLCKGAPNEVVSVAPDIVDKLLSMSLGEVIADEGASDGKPTQDNEDQSSQ